MFSVIIIQANRFLLSFILIFYCLIEFSNTSGSNRSAWENYSTNKTRILSDGFGSKTVYAEFDTNNDGILDASAYDVINYSALPPIGGNITLSILTGISQCIYGTDLTLGNQDVKIGTGYTFTGDFTGSAWSCTDYIASSGIRTFTIQAGDLINENGNMIGSGQVEINHSTGSVSGDPKCMVGSATGDNWTIIDTPYTLMKREAGGEQTCSVTIPTVSLRVKVPANQAPGSYYGDLTIYIPNF